MFPSRRACVFVLILIAVASPSLGKAAFGHAIAQRDFDHGMAMYYGFDYEEAIRWFERAALVEPRNPLPQWAIALSLGPNINDRTMDDRMSRAYTAAQKAQALAQGYTGRERDLVDAIAVRYTTAPTFDLHELNRAYAERMRQVAEKYPQDDDIQTLYAESLLLLTEPTAQNAHTLASPDALAVVETVLARNPRHLGANHYEIHLLEGVDPERALPSARRLDQMRPEAGHLLHMPSHITIRLGDYQAAVASNLRAVAADRASAQHNGHEPMMAAHSREFLASVACMTGQSAVARQADDNVYIQLRFERWRDVLQLPEPKRPVGILEWRVARVLALVGSGRLRDAELERDEYNAVESMLPADGRNVAPWAGLAQWWANPIETVLPMFRNEMDARIAWASNDRAVAIQHWRDAVMAQDQLARVEAVQPWFHPLRESLGAALYLNGSFKDADQVFRDDLVTNPENGRSLFGLWKSLEAQHRDAEAAVVERRFKKAWRSADVALSMEEL